MNTAAFLAGYMHKQATNTIESFVPPTADPSPQTDKGVNEVQEAAKEKATDITTSNMMAEEEVL